MIHTHPRKTVQWISEQTMRSKRESLAVTDVSKRLLKINEVNSNEQIIKHKNIHNMTGIIRPAVTYARETWVLTQKHEQYLCLNNV